jgi:hypothetical protein
MIKLNPNQYRFLTVVSRMGQAGRDMPSGSPMPIVEHPYQIDWYIQKELAYTIESATSQLTTDTTFTWVAGHTARLTTYQNLRNVRTGESVRLSLTAADITATTTANMLRSVGPVPAQAVLAGDKWIIEESSRTEASLDPVPTGFKPELVVNYTGESALSAGATMKMMTSKQYAGWGPDADHKLTADNFRYQLENQLLFSELEFSTATDGYPVSRPAGLMSVLQTNVQTWANVPDWPTFVNLIYPYGRYGRGGLNGSGVKHLFLSRSWTNWVDSLPNQQIVINDPNKPYTDYESGLSWGWQVRVLIANGVKYVIHPMPHWDEFSGGALNMAQAGLVVDAYEIGVRYRDQGRVALLPARSAGGGRAPANATYETICWHADQTLQYNHEAFHGVFFCPQI